MIALPHQSSSLSELHFFPNKPILCQATKYRYLNIICIRLEDPKPLMEESAFKYVQHEAQNMGPDFRGQATPHIVTFDLSLNHIHSQTMSRQRTFVCLSNFLLILSHHCQSLLMSMHHHRIRSAVIQPTNFRETTCDVFAFVHGVVVKSDCPLLVVLLLGLVFCVGFSGGRGGGHVEAGENGCMMDRSCSRDDTPGSYKRRHQGDLEGEKEGYNGLEGSTHVY